MKMYGQVTLWMADKGFDCKPHVVPFEARETEKQYKYLSCEDRPFYIPRMVRKSATNFHCIAATRDVAVELLILKMQAAAVKANNTLARAKAQLHAAEELRGE